MGILKFLFKSKPPPQETTYKIVERHLDIDDHRYQVAVRKDKRELYAENIFQEAEKSRDLIFSRFFLLHENPPKPHFAPSLEEAVDWFRGRNLSKDGYGHIWWGDHFVYKCASCQARRELPLRITEVEHLTVVTVVPHSLSIEGWRVIEVETEITGKGTPIKKVDTQITVPTIAWHEVPNQYLCRKCSKKLADVGRGSEAADYFVFDTE
jgi:DNA-directed RNA polymerase subunit RPC12/RpoP